MLKTTDELNRHRATIEVMAARTRSNMRNLYMEAPQAVDTAAGWMERLGVCPRQIEAARKAIAADPSLLVKS